VNGPWAQILLTRHQMIEAIRKVRELHRPDKTWASDGAQVLRCATCMTSHGESVRFPCPTYEATI